MNKALEPERAPDEMPAFIEREGTAYGLRAGADVWIDADKFLEAIARADKSTGDNALAEYRRALDLYQDDYLAVDARYDDWASAERERLMAQYLRAADRLAQELLARGDVNIAAYDECVNWCTRILARDSCWEHAYQLMMRAHIQCGQAAQARRVYEQCVRVFREELGVEPSAATVQVFEQIGGKG